MDTTTHSDPAGLEVPDGYRLARIPVEQLDHFPGNVREDYQLSEAFLASLAAELQVPLTVIPIPDDHPRGDDPDEQARGWWVVKGNRRLAGARKAGLTSLLCLIDLTKTHDRAEAFIDQVVENDDDFRKGLNAFEQARALFLAHRAGATRTRIRKKTGRSREQVAQAIAAGKLSEQTREQARAMAYEWTLDELAMLAEFDGDAEALARIQDMMGSWNYPARHAIEILRAERAEAAAHAAAVADLEQAGVTVTDGLPDQAVRLSRLAGQVDGFDAAGHAGCAGHGAYLAPWAPRTPEFYCRTPEVHGYQPPPSPAALPEQARAEEVSRQLVVQGNRAWMAAAEVRQEWLAEFLARKSAPKLVQRFVTRVLHDMPAAVRDKLATASQSVLYGKLGGPADLSAALAAAAPGRLTVLQLVPIAVAWEHQISQASAECKNTWRPGRYSPCSTEDAALWLRFLVRELGPELGEQAYQPSPIERAVIDGTPYRGDTPPQEGPLTGQDATEPGAGPGPDPGVEPPARRAAEPGEAPPTGDRQAAGTPTPGGPDPHDAGAAPIGRPAPQEPGLAGPDEQNSAHDPDSRDGASAGEPGLATDRDDRLAA